MGSVEADENKPMTQTEFQIRTIEACDINALHTMMAALADNQGERAFLTVSPDRLLETGFGDEPRWGGFIAEAETGPAGYATYTEDFHLWSGEASIHLDDIFVYPSFRSAGLGEKLMRRVFQRAREIGARVDWTVQPDNDRAIAFYKKLGAAYRVTGKCIWRSD